jgi:hypothetical protein
MNKSPQKQPYHMKKQQQRIVIYPKDVVIITGFKPQAARKMLRQIRANLGKAPRAFVTISEFCSYIGMTEEQVRPFLDS